MQVDGSGHECASSQGQAGVTLTGRIAETLALAMMGVSFLISQVLVLRAFLLVFQGNEFSIGIVLGNWFLLEAVGSWVFGKRVTRAGDSLGAFAAIQAVLSILLPLTLVAIMGSRYLPGVSPWEALSPVRMAVLSCFLLVPLAMANGAAFVYGCRLLERDGKCGAKAPGRVYCLESAGAFVGGVLFTFLLVGRLNAMEMAFGLGALNMSSAFLLLRVRGSGRSAGKGDPSGWRHKGMRIVCFFLIIAFLAGLLSHSAERIHQWSMSLRWFPMQLERTADSIYGNITVLRLGEERILYENGIPAIALPYPDIAALEERVHLPLLVHPAPRDILFVGGGVGGALTEALKHPVRHVVYVELDPLLIRTVEDVSPENARLELGDPRTEVVLEDGRSFLCGQDRRFDVILILLPDAATLQLNRFYTEEFFRLARDRLKPGGILTLTAPGSMTYLSDEMTLVNRCMRDTLQAAFPRVRLLPGDRNLFLASVDAELASADPALLSKRIEERNLGTSVVRSGYLRFKMDPDRERWLGRGLDASPEMRLNRDMFPSLLSSLLAYRNAEVQPGMREAVLFLQKIDTRILLGILLAVNLPLLVWAATRKKRRPFALGYSILTSGFAGMAVEMAVIVSFQSLYGYLYQWIGLLIAVFMAGLAAGAWLTTGRLERMKRGYRMLLLLEIVLTCVLISTVWWLPRGQTCLLGQPGLSGALKWILLGMNLVVGLLVGSEFPLVNRESLLKAGTSVTAVAGRLYALDLAGAWLGTLLVGVFLIPFLGIPNTLLLVGTTKALAIACLALGIRETAQHVRTAG